MSGLTSPLEHGLKGFTWLVTSWKVAPNWAVSGGAKCGVPSALYVCFGVPVFTCVPAGREVFLAKTEGG